MMVERAQAEDRVSNDVVINVPDDKTSRMLNILVHSIALVIYVGFLIWVLYNILMFVIFKQRYKEFSIVLYYGSFLGLFTNRIIEACLQMKVLNNSIIRDTIIAADCFSICIGIAHISLVGDLINTLLFFDE